MLEALGRVTAAERTQAGERVCAWVRERDLWRRAATLLLFMPMSSEPDLLPLVTSALQAGQRVALPRYDRAHKEYRPRAIRSLAEVQPGYFGIPEPTPDCPEIAPNQLDLVLVPGVAYDRAGRRLGRGKGYYDRLLAQVPGHKCGVAFDFQVVPAVPWEPHDVLMDALVTPQSWEKSIAPGTS